LKRLIYREAIRVLICLVMWNSQSHHPLRPYPLTPYLANRLIVFPWSKDCNVHFYPCYLRHICIRCGYCYSCHWKREQVEEIELRDNLKDFYVSLSKARNDDDKQKQKLEQYEVKDQELEKWGTLNVLGQPVEPICTYYRCHHKFSLHGSRRCRCKHPTNKTLGIQVRYL
jgi:hypothetical protein